MVARKPPRPTAERRARAAEIVDRLERAMPDVKIALDYGSDVELLVAVILSAQSTDVGVNKATPALFARFPDADAFARATPEELWPYVQRVGLYRNKCEGDRRGDEGDRARSTAAGCRARARRSRRCRASGARRRAWCLVHLGAAQAFPVDTHVGRVARRLGLSREENPDKVERDLCALLPEERWSKGHLLFVWHGRRVCKALAPACSRCPVEPLCPKRGVSAAIRR